MEIVNGYPCKNCTDVDYAKKGIDPAHPKDGPYGVNARPKPGETDGAEAPKGFGPAVTFGGALAERPAQPAPDRLQQANPPARLDIRV